MKKPRIVIFASGTREGGGSGFENLVKSPDLDAEIVAVVSNHEHGGVCMRAEKLGVPFIYFNPSGHSDILQNTRISVGDIYKKIVEETQAEWVALSGWLKRVEGLDPARTFNIHPALLSLQNRRFGGPGLYGHRVHDAVKVALEADEITESGPTMHFTTEEFDKGPIFFEYRLLLQKEMNADEIAHAVNKIEHAWQPRITNMVVHGEISWDGKDQKSLMVPSDYEYLSRI